MQAVGVARGPSTSGHARKTGDNACRWNSLRSLSRSALNMFIWLSRVYSWSGISLKHMISFHVVYFRLGPHPSNPGLMFLYLAATAKFWLFPNLLLLSAINIEDLRRIRIYVNTSPEGSTDWATKSSGEEPRLQATCIVAARHCVALVALSGEFFPLIYRGTWMPWMVLGAEPWPVWILEHAWSSHIAFDS